MISPFDPLLRDLRSARRMLAARPGWTVAAILCLAIATGANTAAFTLVNGLLLRPLPFDEPEELVMVALREPKQTVTRPFALREYRELAEQSGVSPLDAPTLATVCAVLLATGLASLYLPARWASRIEPAQTLRGE